MSGQQKEETIPIRNNLSMSLDTVFGCDLTSDGNIGGRHYYAQQIDSSSASNQNFLESRFFHEIEKESTRLQPTLFKGRCELVQAPDPRAAREFQKIEK